MPQDEPFRRFDLVDVVCKRLKEAGIENAKPFLPDARRFPEFAAVRCGVPGAEDAYYNMAFDTAVRLSLYFCRRVDTDAMKDAQVAEITLRTRPLDSGNGSYRLVSVETVKPRPVRWDDSGREVWVVEATVHVEMKEF